VNLGYFPQSTRIDFNSRFKLTTNLDLYFDVINLTRELRVTERAAAGRAYSISNYGRKASFGLNARF